MTMQSHLVELEKRHQALEREIEEALAHPSTDTLAQQYATEPVSPRQQGTYC